MSSISSKMRFDGCRKAAADKIDLPEAPCARAPVGGVLQSRRCRLAHEVAPVSEARLQAILSAWCGVGPERTNRLLVRFPSFDEYRDRLVIINAQVAVSFAHKLRQDLLHLLAMTPQAGLPSAFQRKPVVPQLMVLEVAPESLTWPATSSLAVGAVEPMPKLPVALTRAGASDLH